MKFHFKFYEELSNEYDSEGNQLTKEQAEFFKDSKVRDKQGRLLVCYHGTKSPGFTEFKPQSSKSQFGAYKFKDANINYFASNKESARGYTELGIERDGNIYACYLNIVNPYIVDNETKEDIKSWRNIKDRKIRQKQIKYFERIYSYWQYYEDWDDNDVESLNNDFYPLGFFFKEDDDGYYSLWEMEKNTLWGNEHAVIPGYTLTEFFEDDDLYDEMYEHIIGDKEYEDDFWFNTDEIVKYVLLMNQEDKTNYDGIIIPDIIDVGPHGSPFTSFGTDVVTLKSSNQIKSVTNKNPSSSNNINEDLMHKSGMYVFYSPYALMDFLKNQTNDIRILYDSNLDLYFACDADRYIHYNLIKQAEKEGYYYKLNDFIDELGAFENYIDYGVNGGYIGDDGESYFDYIDPYLYYIIFSPNNEFELGDDDYDQEYNTSVGRFLTRDCDLEEIDLYELVKRYMK